MKKQILILTFFTLAVFFAGMNKVNAQYTNYIEGASAACTPAVGLTCASSDDELHPLPGKVYSYGVTVTPGTFQSIHWFVTDDPNVIATQNALTSDIDAVNGSYVLTATAPYNTPANTSATVDISWKSFDPVANEVLLVAYVTGAAGCSDNVEVYRIEPTFAFTLDVAGLLDNGTLGAEECVSPVESAEYTGSANLTMDYGENWVFFSVNAANFVDSWNPTFSAAVTGGSSVTAVEWAYPADALADVNWNATGVPVDASSGAGGAVGPSGECIVVRVQVDHANNELDASVAPAVVTLSIDGIMSDPAAAGTATEYTNTNYADLDEGTPSCVNDVTDTANYTLTPRPSITTNTTVGTGDKAFEPKN